MEHTHSACGDPRMPERGRIAAYVARRQARAAELRRTAAAYPKGHMDRLWYVGAARLELVRARVARGEYDPAPQGWATVGA